MPITPERQNIEELRAAGFTETQAIVLATKFEAATEARRQDFKSFFRAELDKHVSALVGEFNRRVGEEHIGAGGPPYRRTTQGQVSERCGAFGQRIERRIHIHTAIIVSTYVVVTTLAVAIIKLF
jgi:hypothetical protein